MELNKNPTAKRLQEAGDDDASRVFYDYAIFQVAYVMEKKRMDLATFVRQCINLGGSTDRGTGMLWILEGCEQVDCRMMTALMLKKMTKTCEWAMFLPAISADIPRKSRFSIDWGSDDIYKLSVCLIVGEGDDKVHFTRTGEIEALSGVLANPEAALKFDEEVSVVRVKARVEKIKKASVAWLEACE